MNLTIAERIDALRAEMKKAGIYATIIPHVDPHQSEYIAAHWQVRRFLSGFTGSAGDLVITPDHALLWTDSRYFIQAAQQIEGTPFQLMKDGLPGTPSIIEWICNNVSANLSVGVDGMLFSHTAINSLRHQLSRHGINLNTDFDPIDNIWTDRPALPDDKVIIHDVKYAGQSASDKIAAILDKARNEGADSVLLTALDEIAWTLNIRSTDVPCNPVVTSFLFLSPFGSKLFIDSAKLTPEVVEYLRQANVKCAEYSDIIPFLAAIPGGKVMLQDNRVAERLYSAINVGIIAAGSPVALAKACKNEVQIQGIKAAMERDGAALVRAFIEIENTIANRQPLTEIDVDNILRKYRSQQPLFFDLSFDTIAGYGAHGAIVHYSATEESNADIRPENLLLIDSGAQYFDGTTDITRTITLG
ncbi:MAG: aminopeptidase P family N-terminal domain-containing protein, partial [Muribaculaceae bacterium]|nr:aminopeptidase P family N-terminal domain-containing protein [Muribaculaceae bacterium]